MQPAPRFIRTLLALMPLVGLGFAVAAPEPGAGDAELYGQKVEPLLARRCYACHSGQAAAPQGGLRLDSRAVWLRGGNSGPAVVPGAPHRSRPIQAARSPPT